MKQKTGTISSLQDLEDYGLNCLTGESCAYGMRLLFDFNEDGADLLATYFGIPIADIGNNWNSRVGDKDAVGSILLSADTAWHLAAFALLKYGFDVVIPSQEQHHHVHGFDFTDAGAQEYYDNIKERGTLMVKLNPRTGSRNTHQFSGRTV